MQQIQNAGIIVYRENKVPQLLSMLTSPKLEDCINIKDKGQEINIYILNCPAYKDKLDKKTYKQLKELVDKYKIKFLVEHFDRKVQSNVPVRKNEPHYTELLPYIEAVKQLAAIIKLSQDREKNLLIESFGFIMGKTDITKIDLLSEEASNIMLYESVALTDQLKKKLHNDFMEKKGVSIIFTKAIDKIIDSSAILSIDEEVDLSNYTELLNNKVILGKSKNKDIKSIESVILWQEEMEKLDKHNTIIEYNSEILVIMRYFYNKLDIIDFIRKLPYIYINRM